MGSRRLPGKSMLAVWREMPLIELVLRRVGSARLVDEVMLVTSEHARDEPLAAVARELGVAVFRGSEDDVLGRFAGALNRTQADAVVRVCADNPFVEPSALDRLVDLFKAGQPCDYATNSAARCGLPDGIGAEVLTAEALLDAAREARGRSEREHVCQFIVERPARFSLAYAPAPEPALPRAKLDIDTPADYSAMCELAGALPDDDAPLWSCETILDAWRRTTAR